MATPPGACLEPLSEKEANPAHVMPEVPSFLAGEYGSEVPRELVVTLGAADEALKHLRSTLREVGLSMEPGFKV